MSCAIGEVRQIEDGIARVAVTRAVGCGRCHEPGGCGGTLVGAPGLQPVVEYLLPSVDGVAEGDRVEVRVPEGAVLHAAFRSYGLVTLLALAGAALPVALGAGDGPALAGLGIGLLFGWWLLRRHATRLRSPLVLSRLPVQDHFRKEIQP
ncbi:MAG: SoxR reducing system RseC family protein [Proteobacteria bacterium]|nr:SoxR reducing system RseC family protein [Pseudomonadota bacterium]HQR02627.1 SoxR reducing system RseC family protein [Rhodocyclaceae bacterium]